MTRAPFCGMCANPALAIQSFVTGMDMAAYAGNAMAQAAVERKFEIIGEALNQ